MNDDDAPSQSLADDDPAIARPAGAIGHQADFSRSGNMRAR
jgi:hypothetical protein